MQGSSRVQGTSLALLTYLLYSYPDKEICGRWKWFGAALGLGAQVAWYEVLFVFPTNDRLAEMEGELKGVKSEEEKERTDREIRGEVLRLLEQWRKWHIGRIVIPLVWTGLALRGLIF